METNISNLSPLTLIRVPSKPPIVRANRRLGGNEERVGSAQAFWGAVVRL